MAMTAQLWSISALAVEFNLDRRTAAKRIESIAPAGELNGKPAWRLRDVAGVLTSDKSPAPPRPPAEIPACFTRLAHLNPIDQAATFAMQELIYRTHALTAIMAVAAGAECKVAYAAANATTLAMMQAAGEIAQETGIQPLAQDRGADIWQPDSIQQPDWQALACQAGEQVDVQSWQAWTAKRFTGETPQEASV